jgi:hypothetical protein
MHASLPWRMYRWLLAFICLVCLIGAIGGNPADVIALAVVGNGLVGVHGWINDHAYGWPGLWRALVGLDALLLGYYGVILGGAEGGPPGWSLLLMLALIFGPMLYALQHYGWRSPQLWDSRSGPG